MCEGAGAGEAPHPDGDDDPDADADDLAHALDGDDADAVFLSGVGLQTMDVLAALERDLRKPVISSVAALTWASLRAIGVHEPVSGYGQLLAS